MEEELDGHLKYSHQAQGETNEYLDGETRPWPHARFQIIFQSLGVDGKQKCNQPRPGTRGSALVEMSTRLTVGTTGRWGKCSGRIFTRDDETSESSVMVRNQI